MHVLLMGGAGRQFDRTLKINRFWLINLDSFEDDLLLIEWKKKESRRSPIIKAFSLRKSTAPTNIGASLIPNFRYVIVSIFCLMKICTGMMSPTFASTQQVVKKVL